MPVAEAAVIIDAHPEAITQQEKRHRAGNARHHLCAVRHRHLRHRERPDQHKQNDRRDCSGKRDLLGELGLDKAIFAGEWAEHGGP